MKKNILGLVEGVLEIYFQEAETVVMTMFLNEVTESVNGNLKATFNVNPKLGLLVGTYQAERGG